MADIAALLRGRCPLHNVVRRGVELATTTPVGLPRTNFSIQPPPAFVLSAANPNPFLAPPTDADAAVEVEVHVDIARSDTAMLDADATTEEAAPSRQDLLQRAAELGPSRLTWESFALTPTDPILGEKMQPRVAERRARFRKVVKVAVGACVAFCLVAMGASALSSTTTKTASDSPLPGKTAPAIGIVPVEKLEQPTIVKAAHVPTHATAAARPRAPKKRR